MKNFIIKSIENSLSGDWEVEDQSNTKIYSTILMNDRKLVIMESKVTGVVLVLINGGTVLLSGEDKNIILNTLQYL